ncbi:MAG: purine-nucleoside phosphorylase [Lachnospiraceae bacterium]|nr:purine-nucleoside phosphorylase [Lachnospiraceae bacterium]
MGKIYDRIEKCYDSVVGSFPKLSKEFVPKVAVILGSGLGELADEIDSVGSVAYNDIEDFPVSTVSGHKGRFVFGYIGEVPVVLMQGRVHHYEGYSMEDVVLPVRLMKRMGAEFLFLTNAAGGIDPSIKPGSLMLIIDQISTFVRSPLIGENDEKLGVRFPDMSEVYDKDLRDVIRNAASKLGIELYEGVYIQFTGPQYESPAEVRMARMLGASVVGMSTACEAVAANHMGMKICGISCITNLASGVSDKPLDHEEVKETADRVSKEFKELVKLSVEGMA